MSIRRHSLMILLHQVMKCLVSSSPRPTPWTALFLPPLSSKNQRRFGWCLSDVLDQCLCERPRPSGTLYIPILTDLRWNLLMCFVFQDIWNICKYCELYLGDFMNTFAICRIQPKAAVPLWKPTGYKWLSREIHKIHKMQLLRFFCGSWRSPCECI